MHKALFGWSTSGHHQCRRIEKNVCYYSHVSHCVHHYRSERAAGKFDGHLQATYLPIFLPLTH